MMPLRLFALSLLLFGAAAHALDSWEGTAPFATGQGNREISAMAVTA